MNTFVPRSRKQKNKPDTPQYQLSELTKHEERQSREFSEPKAGLIRSEKSDAALIKLRKLYLAGRLKGMTLELPKLFIPDLETWLAKVYRRSAHEECLEEIATLIVKLPFLEVN